MNDGPQGEGLETTLKNLPTSSGIYKFFNKKNTIIYIGKSKNLRSRVNSYFNGKSKLNFAKQEMVGKIFQIDFIVTNNETEALMLEATLIKKHQPKYNILLKDGKDHTYIKITQEVIPKVVKTRIKTHSGQYFGPYLSTHYATNLLKITKKLFGHRSCNLIFIEDEGKLKIKNKNIKIPCMDYYIGRCAAPCLIDTNYVKEYRESIDSITKFLKGDFREIRSELEGQMRISAKKLDFEKAQSLKQDIESLSILESNQIVRDGIDGDCDVIHFIEKYGKFYIGKLEITDSKISGFYTYEIENNLEESKETIFHEFLFRKYFREDVKKKRKIIASDSFSVNPEKYDFVSIEFVKIGVKSDLIKLCYKNLYEYAYKKYIASLSSKNFTKQNMKQLLILLGYKEINKNIVFECNDISHISGNHTVASRTVIENGKLNKNKYRKYKIKELAEQKIDDFNSMREVIQRRVLELEKLGNYPDLLVIDGGKGQLSSVMEIIDNSGLNIQVVSLAKREEELFIPGRKEPIILEKNSSELRMLQKIRDEAHRFAITFNRDSRIKSMKKNILEGIDGIGPKTRKKITTMYGNVDNLKGVSTEELSKHLPKNVVEALDNHGLL